MGNSKGALTSSGIKLDDKKEKDEDAKPLPPVAAIKPVPQETSFCMLSL